MIDGGWVVLQGTCSQAVLRTHVDGVKLASSAQIKTQFRLTELRFICMGILNFCILDSVPVPLNDELGSTSFLGGR